MNTWHFPSRHTYTHRCTLGCALTRTHSDHTRTATRCLGGGERSWVRGATVGGHSAGCATLGRYPLGCLLVWVSHLSWESHPSPPRDMGQAGEKCKAYFAGKKDKIHASCSDASFRGRRAFFSLWPALSRWKGGEEMKPRKEGRREREKKMMTIIIIIKDNHNK